LTSQKTGVESARTEVAESIVDRSCAPLREVLRESTFGAGLIAPKLSSCQYEEKGTEVSLGRAICECRKRIWNMGSTPVAMTKTTFSVAVLFVDIAGSTGLYERLGNRDAKRLVTVCLDLLRDEARGHSGEIVQQIGDELMCRFPTAECAYTAAIAMQQRICRQHLDPHPSPKVRIGLQWGEVLSDGNNLYGDTVNTAARLTGVAKGGQIMTSEQLIRQLGKAVGDRWRRIGKLPLKGKKKPLPVCEILWETCGRTGKWSALTMVIPSSLRTHHLHLAFGDTHIRMRSDTHPLTLGRDTKNDLVIPYLEVSRFHATIECRIDKFYLIDHSANGTAVIGPDQTIFTLHREEAPLMGCGQILCGSTGKAKEGHASISYTNHQNER
jgi:adenylate cyclase